MMANVSLSDSAARRISEILHSEDNGAMLRVSVSGGGCSGFQYSFELDKERNDDDLVLEKAGAKVLIDETSLGFLAGAEIDYVDDFIGAAFQINNPNASSSCGCGMSFSI